MLYSAIFSRHIHFADFTVLENEARKIFALLQVPHAIRLAHVTRGCERVYHVGSQ